MLWVFIRIMNIHYTLLYGKRAKISLNTHIFVVFKMSTPKCKKQIVENKDFNLFKPFSIWNKFVCYSFTYRLTTK